MRKCFCFLLIFVFLLPLLRIPVRAAEDPQFRYELTVEGKETVEVNPGDIITVTLHLIRSDADAPYTMYAMQSEIHYDSNFFELVEDSALLADGVRSADVAMVDDYREFYMNYLSLSGGVQWQSKTRIGSFQLRVIGESGVSTITNEDFLVSLKDGSGSYKCESNALTVVVTSDCTVKFESNGGSKVDSVQAIFGETLERPNDPVREGKVFAGWYKDIHLTQPWDFDKDTVNGNLTLYAKWENGTEVPPTETPTTPDTQPPTTPGTTVPTVPTSPGDKPPEFPYFWLWLLLVLAILLIVMLIDYLVKRRNER